MFSIDGLVSGLDTSAIIEGLLSIQQTQLDRIDVQKQQVLVRQTAFQGIEANIVALQSAANQLGSFTNDVFAVFSAKSSDESIAQVAADGNATPGTYQVRVSQLATAQQIASQSLASPESLVTQGTIDIQLGDRSPITITIDQDNNTLQGFADAINASGDDVSAALVNDGSGYRVLLTSAHTGAENRITITNNTGPTSGSETQIDLSGPAVQDAADAVINLGSGAGAISISRSTNTFDDVIQGLTLDLLGADPAKDITISVTRDTEPAREAIEGFVNAYNTVMKYIDSQSGFNSETEEAGLLLGDSSTNAIRDQLRNALSRTIGNLESNSNRLSAIGITFDDKAQLQINSSRLDQALSGNLEGVDLTDVRRIFALDGQSTSPYISFVSGSQETTSSENPWQVTVTQAAERASISAKGMIGSSIVIDSKSEAFSIEVDGVSSGDLYLTHGTYTQEELAEHMQSVINQSSALGARQVTVTVDNNALNIESVVFGTRSEVGSVQGNGAANLGFSGSEYSRGRDVAGFFVVEGQTETATGNGRILSGDADNENTAGLQLKVTLSNAQISGTHESDLTVTRGFAAQLDVLIDGLLDEDNGRFKNSVQAYEDQLASIEASATRLNSIFESKQQQLINQFVAIESNISSLQNTSAFLASQLGSVSLLNN